MKLELTEKHKKMIASYGRSVLGAVIALYMAGVTDPKDLWAALVAALAPVVLRAINPNDTAFGRLPNVEVVEEAVKNIKVPVKKTAKRTAPKKSAPKKTTGGSK
jgi:hypothetical protein